MYKLRVILKSISFSIAQATIFRSSFLIFFFWLFIDTLIKILFFSAIYSQVSSIGGWTYEQAVLLVIFHGMMYDFAWTLYVTAFNNFIDNFPEGGFDFILLKPMHPITYITTTGFSATSFSGARLSLLFYAIFFLPIVWHMPNVLAAILVFICGLVAIHGAFAIMSAIIFFVVRGDFIYDLIFNLIDGGQYPFSIFPMAARFFFTFILPVFLIANFPVMMISNMINLDLAWVAIVIAVAIELVAFKVWNYAIKHYSSASS